MGNSFVSLLFVLSEKIFAKLSLPVFVNPLTLIIITLFLWYISTFTLFHIQVMEERGGGGVKSAKSEPVLLNVYDLNKKINKYTGKLGLGLYHSGVQV